MVQEITGIPGHDFDVLISKPVRLPDGLGKIRHQDDLAKVAPGHGSDVCRGENRKLALDLRRQRAGQVL